MVKFAPGLLLLLGCLTLAFYAIPAQTVIPPVPHALYLPVMSKPYARLASKKGIGLTYGHCEDVAALHASWEYGWGDHPANCPGAENVPMGWNGVPESIGGNSPWLMGFNEPDMPGQANLTPERAAELWHQLEAKYPDKKLLSPAPSDRNPQWLVDFRNAYISRYGKAPRLDGLAMHCYAWYAGTCVSLVEWYEQRAKEWGVPEIWLTEYAFFTCGYFSTEHVIEQMQALNYWLERKPIVTRYAWFDARTDYGHPESWMFPRECDTSLVEFATGKLNQFGEAYR